MVAKNDSVHAGLSKQFADRTVEREYRAIVWGQFKRRSGSIETQLGRSKSDRKKIAVVESGKHAVTLYTVIDQFEYLSHMSIHLRTGRTHQIRVHLAHEGHPVFGDPTYGGRRIVAGSRTARQKAEVQNLLGIISRQALHARTLGFVHPATGNSLMFESELPDDMKEVLERVARTI